MGVSSDEEVIDRARVLTGYSDSTIISDSDFQTLVDIAKDEVLRAVGRPDQFSFYSDDTDDADQAVFWFTCIAAKIHTGEIAGMNMELGDLVKQNPGQGHYTPWFRRFRARINAIGASNGPASRTLSRDGREYEDIDI
jgi:hypothetical protein